MIQGKKKVIQARKKEVRFKKSDPRSKKDLPIAWGELCWTLWETVGGWGQSSVGRERYSENLELLARVFQDNFHQCDCAEKLCAQDLSSGVKILGDGTCIASLSGSKTKRAELLAWVLQDKFHQCDCAEKLCAQDLPKFPSPGPWDMHSFVGRERD